MEVLASVCSAETPRRTPITQGHRQRRKEEGSHPRSSFLWSLTSGKCLPLLKSKGKKTANQGSRGMNPIGSYEENSRTGNLPVKVNVDSDTQGLGERSPGASRHIPAPNIQDPDGTANFQLFCENSIAFKRYCHW